MCCRAQRRKDRKEAAINSRDFFNVVKRWDSLLLISFATGCAILRVATCSGVLGSGKAER